MDLSMCMGAQNVSNLKEYQVNDQTDIRDFYTYCSNPETSIHGLDLSRDPLCYFSFEFHLFLTVALC